jgi:hypothetical protein
VHVEAEEEVCLRGRRHDQGSSVDGSLMLGPVEAKSVPKEFDRLSLITVHPQALL